MTEIGSSDDLAPLQYAPNDGLPGLRDYLAGRLETQEGTPVGDGELLVTSGGIEAMQLAATVFLDAGDTVLVEAPTYLGAPMSFASFEASVATVPLDDDGLDVDALADDARGRVAPEVPLHQPRPPEPGRRDARRRTQAGARGPRARARLRHPRGRRLPRVHVRRSPVDVAVVAGSTGCRADRDVLEDLLAGHTARLGGRARTR